MSASSETQSPPDRVPSGLSSSKSDASGSSVSLDSASDPRTVEKKARDGLLALINDKKCAPHLLLDLAWHDAATYDADSGDGGPNGSVRLEEELNRKENTHLKDAVKLCKQIKEKNPTISNADLFQLAGLVAIESAKGPKIAFQLGRKDSAGVSPTNRLLVVNTDTTSKELRDAFNRMGFGDKEIVALSWTWTYTLRERLPLGEPSPSLQFDNSFFQKLESRDSSLLEHLPSCKILIDDAKFHKYVSLYSKKNNVFTRDYTLAHKNLSELGFKYFPTYVRLKQSVLFATTITILVAFLGYFFEVTRR